MVVVLSSRGAPGAITSVLSFKEASPALAALKTK
jgi:hypothetical protein